MALVRRSHVQLAMPPAREPGARRFCGDLLGLREIPKPLALAASGDAWLEIGDVQLHLGVDAGFRPVKKVHVAFEIDDPHSVAAQCRAAAHKPIRTVRSTACAAFSSTIQSGIASRYLRRVILSTGDRSAEFRNASRGHRRAGGSASSLGHRKFALHHHRLSSEVL